MERPRFQDIERALGLNLSQIIQAVGDWLSRKAFQRTSSGEANASNVYLNVVRALSYWGEKKRSIATDRSALVTPLEKLMGSLGRYTKYGLVGSYPVSDFIQLIKDAPEERLDDIDPVLSPYIDSVITRIDAMEEVRAIMSTFEEELHEYLRDKTGSIHITSGLRFTDPSGQVLPPSALSSGERQLIFLFCASLLSRDGQSIFIVDEPELSLNIKWQRKLISSLSKFARGASTQFILASHSLEIMAQHRQSIIELR